jgi:hypothetical protein
MRYCIKKFPPAKSGAGSPFEGVVGTIDYLIYTAFYSPTGVVDSLISSYLYCYEKQKPLLQEKP